MAHNLFSCTVTEVANLCPNLRRITLHSHDFIGYQIDGPDEFFGLLMPQPGQKFQPFICSDMNIRAAVAQLPDETRPELRWYTIRSLDKDTGLLTFDVVLHSHSTGPGSTWISHAQAGDSCGYWSACSLWQPTTGPQVLVSDATGTPALLSILDNLPEAALSRCAVAVCTPTLGEVEVSALRIYAEKVGHFALRCASTTQAPETVHEMLNAMPLTTPEKLWASGENQMVKAVRRHGIERFGLSPKDITFIPFWYLGKPRP